jgi:hypothetical protein
MFWAMDSAAFGTSSTSKGGEIMSLARREFLTRSGITIATLGLGFLQLATIGCGGASSGAGGTREVKNGGDCENNGVTTDVEAVHQPNHDLSIPSADVVAGVDKTYILGDNGSGHIHEITVTAADFAKLQSGIAIQLVSTSIGHTHGVAIGCA